MKNKTGYPATPHLRFAVILLSRDESLARLYPKSKPTQSDLDTLQGYTGKPVGSLNDHIKQWEEQKAKYDEACVDPEYRTLVIEKFAFAGPEEEQERTRLEVENSSKYKFIRWIEEWINPKP